MKLSTVFAACVLASVKADGNTSSPLIVTEEELQEMRKNIEIVEQIFQQTNGRYSCSNDMRDSFPGCHQSGEMWCWATAVAAASEHYNGRAYDQCKGLECQAVTWTFGENCCPFKAKDDVCGEKGATIGQLNNALDHFTSRSFSRSHGPLDEATLSAAIQSGSPVILGVGTSRGPNHIVSLHGCDGSGNFWYHDPERDYGEFNKGNYDWLLNGMCRAWVCEPKLGDEVTQIQTKVTRCDGEAKLVTCQGTKNPNELFRFSTKWWDTLYVPAAVAV